MNRDIKFRAWHKKYNKMINPDYITVDGKCYDYEQFNGHGDEYDPDYILLQFTGLSDKNGKNIYEGDIIKKYDRNSHQGMEISFFNGSFRMTYGTTMCPILDQYEADYCEIIGNIFENPELISK